MKKILVAAFIFAMTLSANSFADIKMGIILGFTGPIESLTPAMRDSARLAFQEASDSGSLLGGEKISVLEGDSTCVDSAAATAAAESTQVESALKGLIVSPPSKEPESEASLKANSADAAIAGVKDSIGPVNPKIIPILISAYALDAKTDKDKIADKNIFFIFSLSLVFYIYNIIDF